MKELICIVCPKGCHLKVDENDNYSVTGNDCPRGAEYGKKELTAPTRVITSTVKVRGGLYSRCPVKTAAPIPKGLIFEAMKLLEKIAEEIGQDLSGGELENREPRQCGQV